MAIELTKTHEEKVVYFTDEFGLEYAYYESGDWERYFGEKWESIEDKSLFADLESAYQKWLAANEEGE